MRVRVKLFAVAKELAGSDTLTIDVLDGASVADLRKAVAAKLPALGQILPHALWAVDTAYADDDTLITQQSDVALIPPVSGG